MESHKMSWVFSSNKVHRYIFIQHADCGWCFLQVFSLETKLRHVSNTKLLYQQHDLLQSSNPRLTTNYIKVGMIKTI